MMKIFIALCFFVAAANAFSLDALKRALEDELEFPMEKMQRNWGGEENEEAKQITLREYLDNLEEPHPTFRKRDPIVKDCSSACSKFKPQTDPSQKCKKEKWVPEYTEVDGCECLSEYRCCADVCVDQTDLEVCWGDGAGNKGLKYGVQDIDCCGCRVVKCLTCPPVETQEKLCSKKKNPGCYSYNAKGMMNPKTGCYEATCPEKYRNAADEGFSDKTCDTSCQRYVTKESTCKFPYDVCAPKKYVNTCPNHNEAAKGNNPRLAKKCYDAGVPVPDAANGNYWDAGRGSCQPCLKWTYNKKSCVEKNKAAVLQSCHQSEAETVKDKKCYTKVINRDSCECDSEVICQRNTGHGEVEMKFKADEVCPKNHVKISGVSICEMGRDICFPCPALIAKDKVECPYGKVELRTDINNCPEHKCVLPTINGKEGCKTFTYSTESGFTCAEG